ncbi:MAG TPA: hypothetical protein VFY87_04665 [Geminicoccaceae bacterium]|nr:hypothetical protein [Geminicoccaceae bacterium]
MEWTTPRLAPGLQVVQGYRAGGFTVSGVRHGGRSWSFPTGC